MRILKLMPQRILIQEQLDNYSTYKNIRYSDYLSNGISKKSVIVTQYKDHLIALDGNKLCTIARLLNQEVNVILLENENDFKNFSKKYNKELYNSRLLDYDNWIQFKKNYLEFFESMYSITEKDFFNKKEIREKFIENSNNYNPNNLKYKDTIK